MSIFDRLQNPALGEFLRDQRLRELVTRREFRVSQDYIHREFIGRMADDDVTDLVLSLHDGFAELSGQVRKRPLPFAIPFSARLTVRGVEFNTMGKRVYLGVEEVRPLDVDWITRKMVDKVPFLDYRDGLLVCDLERIPRLDSLLSGRIGTRKLADFLTLREVTLRHGEIVGRLGVVL
jgi:hypothetical protein